MSSILIDINGAIYELCPEVKEQIKKQVRSSRHKTIDVWFEGSELKHKYRKSDGEIEKTKVNLEKVFSLMNDESKRHLEEEYGLTPIFEECNVLQADAELQVDLEENR